jgi:hypothetical protein
MDVDKVMIWGIVVLTLLVLLVMGPGMWSSSTGYPLLEKPWRWLVARIRKRP